MTPIDYIYTDKSILMLGLSSACEQNILALTVAFGNGGLTASNTTLATELGADRSTIIRAIKRLEQRGFIAVEYGKNGRIVSMGKAASGVKLPLPEAVSGGKPPLLRGSSGGKLQQSGGKPPPKYKELKEETTAFTKYWNTKENLPTIRRFTTQRQSQLKVRMLEPDFAENWKEIVDKVAASAFCSGVNDRGWRGDVDWVLKNSTNYTKVLEGKYDNAPESPGATCSPADTKQYHDVLARIEVKKQAKLEGIRNATGS